MQLRELRLGRGVFILRLWPTVLTALMLVVLLGLGTWQVQRLQWKENLIATIEVRTHEAPINVVNISDPKVADYRSAEASGIFQHDHEFYMTAISLSGEGGYHVLTPLQLDNGQYLLVDRGWIPYDLKGSGKYFQQAGSVTVKGLLRIPTLGWMTPKQDYVKGTWYGIDLQAMADSVGISAFMPFVLQVDNTPNPGGYPVGGQTRITLPNNHLIYAITWYSLALVLLVIYGVSGYRKVSEL